MGTVFSNSVCRGEMARRQRVLFLMKGLLQIKEMVGGGRSPTLDYLMYVVTPILEGLRPPQNLQNQRVCVLYAKTPKSEVLRSVKNISNNI